MLLWFLACIVLFRLRCTTTRSPTTAKVPRIPVATSTFDPDDDMFVWGKVIVSVSVGAEVSVGEGVVGATGMGVGKLVGKLVGDSVGDTVGYLVGECVGYLVGE
mmetsp:Transcript_15992/g.18077  ORF Transcript_15992/g.18077 Transcript_15992/m.18077 type:complete len:104 (-) Transcript_15992:679-990(-)